MEFLDTKLMMAGPVKQFGEFDGFFVKKIQFFKVPKTKRPLSGE